MADIHTAQFGDTITPQQIIADAMDYAPSSKFVMFVFVDDEGEVRRSFSHSTHLNRIGALQVAVAQEIEAMRDKP